MQKTFDNFINQYIKKNGRIGLAVSGGMDSMCLLYLCLNSCKLKKSQLLVFSIDHKIRDEDSKLDVEFVENFCNERQVEFKKITVDVPFLAAKKKESLETAARNERRRIFEELLESGAEYIFTAHHKSDNVESILMHLFRGAGLQGLIGMKNEKGAQILRPLLAYSKDEIKEFVKENNIAFVVDETNEDNRHRRNFIRNEMIPLISSQYGNIENAVINVSKDAALALTQRENVFAKNVIFIKNGECKIEIAALENNEFASDLLVRNLPFEIRKNLERRHFDMVISLVTAQNGVGVDLPNGFRAIREYTHIVIARQKAAQKKDETSISFALGKLNLSGENFEVRLRGGVNNKKNKVLLFDKNKIPSAAVFRFRQDGDVFVPFGKGGSKKLKEYLIDKKVPQRLRDKLICLCDGKEVLVVAGIEISEKIKIEKGSKECEIII